MWSFQVRSGTTWLTLDTRSTDCTIESVPISIASTPRNNAYVREKRAYNAAYPKLFSGVILLPAHPTKCGLRDPNLILDCVLSRK